MFYPNSLETNNIPTFTGISNSHQKLVTIVCINAGVYVYILCIYACMKKHIA